MAQSSQPSYWPYVQYKTENGRYDSTDRCPHAQYNPEPESDGSKGYMPLSVYLKSAANCSHCAILLQALDEYKPGWISEHKNGTEIPEIDPGFGNGDGFFSGLVRFRLRPPQDDRVERVDSDQVDSFQIYHSTQKDHIYDDIAGNDSSQQSLDIIENTFSQAAFDRAATWLSCCLEEDRECDNPNSSFMPRRLLNVGSLESPSDPYLFEPVEPSAYVCLSYCWGTDLQGIVTTKKANLRSHYEAIPYDSLSLTIRDAITVCRGLGISNLWVDALCIVQDDRSSWLQESAEMGNIYGNSRLTIAALEPASCKLGFLGQQRYGSREWQRRFTPILDGQPTASLFIRQNTIPGDEIAQTGFTLDKRGWCLQESLLPNRRLCFNGYEMTWECQQRTTCECGHSMHGLPETTSIGRLGSNIKSATSTSNSVLSRFHNQKDPTKPYEDVGALLIEFLSPVSEWFQNPDKPTQRHEVWRALVEEYSNRSLTQPTDKLSAVSGLAKNFKAQYTSAVYFAGLWKVEFLFYSGAAEFLNPNIFLTI